MLAGVFVLVAAGGLFWLAYRRPRPRRWLIPRRPVAAVAAAVRRAPAAVAELDRAAAGDPADQAARWAAAAADLRRRNRTDALPAVLRCADAAAGQPAGASLAAEAVGFPNFADLMYRDGRLGVRALVRAARGARDGTVNLAALVRAGLGDHLADVGETVPPAADPWLTAAVLEAERAARRAGHWARLLPPDVRRVAERQGTRLAASASRRRGWLAAAPGRLVDRFPVAAADEQAAILRTLDDLRADVSALFPDLPDRRALWWADAVRCLPWAQARPVGPALAAQADRLLAARRPGPAAGVVLAALRGSRCPEAEAVLVRAAAHPDAAARRAAAGALGWADPFAVGAVVAALRTARDDADAGVRRAAAAALARFGELAALREFARGLLAEDAAARHAVILSAAAEGVTWLWPDLDYVAEAADPDTALVATEALERLREAALGLAD